MRRRLHELERRLRPAQGELPVILSWPEDEAEQRIMAAEIVERESRGQQVVLLHHYDDALEALADLFV